MTIALIFASSGAVLFMMMFLIALIRDARVSRTELRVSRIENVELVEPEREKSNARAA
jgi:hypothetical protein